MDRNIAIALGVSLICWEIYFDVVIAPFVEWSRKELDKLSPEELQKLDEESDRFFVPLPFTTRKIEQRPYRGTDPEWQEFIKLSKDIALQKNIRSMNLPFPPSAVLFGDADSSRSQNGRDYPRSRREKPNPRQEMWEGHENQADVA